MRVEEDANGDGTSEATLAEYVYDRFGRRIEHHAGGYDPNSPSPGPGSAAVSGVEAGWQDDGDLARLVHTFSGQTVTFSYEYDGSGRLTDAAADVAGWLWNASDQDYDLSYADVNAQNQYAGVTFSPDGEADDVWTLTWDEADNLIGDGTRFFNHDTQNRLTGASLASCASSALRACGRRGVGNHDRVRRSLSRT
ncbi:hypothetical protein [Marinicauda salina]|uniref:hypothetical protein n=1 Tax=Marinicauda salina TaxID=2135793 RepID=UPI001E519596|nr:hypothetical protein [Marinicauda salina]